MSIPEPEPMTITSNCSIKINLKYAQENEELKTNKPFNCKGSIAKNLLSVSGLFVYEAFLLSKKPKSAEEEKKKAAYYSKTEKKAKAVKK